MKALEIVGVSKRFGDVQALDGINLSIDSGSLVVLLGPTGAGKTTLQRIIGGLELPDEGRVLVDGRDVTDLPPKDRNISMVFESLALYPNYTAFENMAHPLRIKGDSDTEIKNRVFEIAEMLHVSHILDRKPASFSGGEKQRIAIGRALVKPASVYLLDEPLSSLDALLRTSLRSELKRLLSHSGHTFLLATPDYTEALALGDNVTVIMDGQVRQSGAAHDLYSEPGSTAIATFVGNPPMNLIPGSIISEGQGGKVGIGDLTFDLADQKGLKTGDEIIVGIRPEDLKLACGDKIQRGMFSYRADILDQEALGNRTTLLLRIDDLELTASIETENNLYDLTSVKIVTDPSRFHYFSKQGVRLQMFNLP